MLTRTIRLGIACAALAVLVIACASAEREPGSPHPELLSPARPTQSLTLPMGEADGIEVGMRLHVSNRIATIGEVEVVDVHPRHCVARFVPFRLEWALPPWKIETWSERKRATAIDTVVHEVDDRRRTLVISAGASRGVEIGMRFQIMRRDSCVADARIVKVLDEQSIGSVVKIWPGMEIRPGDKASRWP
jgi:hypothetical protein